jgi:dipeptidyl-peptidase-4
MTTKPRALWIAFVLACVASFPTHAAGTKPVTLDAFITPRSLIGTVPDQYAWSPDSSQLAFAWNDAGGQFRDIWVYAPGSGKKRRLTNLSTSPDSPQRGVSGIVWLSRDRLAYTISGRLFTVDMKGQSTPLELDKSEVRQLRVSPDGRSLSFATGGPESGYLHEVSGRAALWVRSTDPASRQPTRQIVAGPNSRSFIDSHEWSADSSRIAFVVGDNSTVPQRDVFYHHKGEPQVYRVNRSFPGEPTTRKRVGVADPATAGVKWMKLEEEQYPIWNYGLSSDGGRLFVNTSNYVVKRHTIYVFDTASGSRETFYDFEDPTNVSPGWQAEWAPGNAGLIILTDRDGYYHLHHQPAAGAQLEQLTSGKWEIESFEVDAKQGQIYFVANESHLSERQLYRVPFNGGEYERLTRRAGTHSAVYSSDYRYVADDFSSDDAPPDLYVKNLRDKQAEQQVTQSPREDFASYQWGVTSYLEFPSHRDGTTLLGRLTVPVDFDRTRKYPLIVGSVYANTVRNQWGRGVTPAWGLDHTLTSKGYLVLKVNVRGSWGQGKKFTSGLIRDYGGIDTDDIESGVRHMVAQGYVDPKRVAIWGSSYGGLMTLMSLFKKPGLYAAGIAGAPATNVAHAYPSQMWVMGEPKGDDFPERYERQSALYQTKGLADPLMLIHGTRDVVVLYSDTIALTERLMAQGKKFELVTLPGGNHSWATDSPDQTRFAYQKMLDFFDEHLKPAAGDRE